MQKINLFFAFILLLEAVNCANILYINVLVSHSHHMWNEQLSVALAEKGHNVTLFSHGGKKKDHKNYHVLEITGGHDTIFDNMKIEDSPKEDASQRISVEGFFEYLDLNCDFSGKSDAFKRLMNYPKNFKFDLIIFDKTAGECFYPLIKHFANPPVVIVSPFGIQPYINWMMGMQINNYIPYYALTFHGKPTFMERLKMTMGMAYFMYYRQFVYLKRAQEMAKQFFGEDVGDFAEIEKNFDLALVNINPNLDYPQPLPNNIISIGGLQAKPAKPLTPEFQKVFDESKTDIIYFSLGTTVKAELLGDDILESFTKCFETLPYTILWKIAKVNVKLPKNVITKSFMPQSDVLGQSKTKLFISHGGLLSTQEAMYHGVPVVGLPFMLDQIGNIQSIQSRKLGRLLEYHKITTKYVCDTIKTVLTAEYYENMQGVSRRIKDQQNTPMEIAVFSIEHILRHGSGKHLASVIRDMNLIEIYNLDIILLGLLILISPFVIAIALCYCCCKKKKTAEDQRKLKKN